MKFKYRYRTYLLLPIFEYSIPMGILLILVSLVSIRNKGTQVRQGIFQGENEEFINRNRGFESLPLCNLKKPLIQ